jgi:ATP-binding cassette subfamily B protein
VNRSEAPALAVLRRGWASSPELRRGFGLSVLLALVGAAGRVAVPVLATFAIDRGLPVDAPVRLDVVVGLGAVAAVVVVIATACSRIAAARTAIRGERALHDLRVAAFGRIMQFDLAEHAEERRGVLVARTTTDIETMSQFFAWGGVAWLVNSAVFVAVAVTMLVYDWRLAVVAFAASAPSVVVFRALQRRLIRAYGRVRERVAELFVALSEVVTGAAVIRAYGVQERTTARVRAAVDAHREAAVRANSTAALLFPSGELFAVVTVGCVVVVAIALGPGDTLSRGAVVGFLLLVNRFLDPIAEFTELLDQTQTAVSAWRRVLDVLDTPVGVAPPDGGSRLPSGPLELRLTGVRFAYRPRSDGGDGAGAAGSRPVWALDGIDVVVPAGQTVAVVGATGSGKSTLARLVVRFADPQEGHVGLGGLDVRTVEHASLRRAVVLVPQEPFLFDRTIADNVRFGRPEATDAEVVAAFRALDLEPWLATLPRGMSTPVGERGGSLSLGERQLVALARASLADPQLLVLDEATSAVDPGTDALLGRALARLAEGRTALVIAHRLSTAARADRILVLDHGRLVEDGTHAALVAAGGVYARLHASWLDATTVVAD